MYVKRNPRVRVCLSVQATGVGMCHCTLLEQQWAQVGANFIALSLVAIICWIPPTDSLMQTITNYSVRDSGFLFFYQKI